MEGLIILLIILLILFGGGGWFTGSRGNVGLGNVLYVLAALVLIVIVLRLLGIWV